MFGFVLLIGFLIWLLASIITGVILVVQQIRAKNREARRQKDIALAALSAAAKEKFARFTQQAQGTPPPPVFTKPEKE